jgi:hypothetical protein
MIVSLDDGSIASDSKNGTFVFDKLGLLQNYRKTPSEYEDFRKEYPHLVPFYNAYFGYDPTTKKYGPNEQILGQLNENERWSKYGTGWQLLKYLEFNQVYLVQIYEKYLNGEDRKAERADVIAFPDGDYCYVEPMLKTKVKIFERADKKIVSLDYKNQTIYEYDIVFS